MNPQIQSEALALKPTGETAKDDQIKHVYQDRRMIGQLQVLLSRQNSLRVLERTMVLVGKISFLQ